MGLATFMKNPSALMLMSFILGLGVAIMFRPVCKDGACKIVHGPTPAAMNGNVYQFGDKCYLYSSSAVPCTGAAIDSS